MEGIEDPKKLRETWEVCKELELDKYQALKQYLKEILTSVENGYTFVPGSELFKFLQQKIQ